nr:BV-like protein [Cotesia vestalis bracovirus]
MVIVMKIKQFFIQLKRFGFMVSRKSDKISDLEAGYPGDLEASSDYEYLRARRRWSEILIPSKTEGSSYYGGRALMMLVSQRKSDLQICGLPCCNRSSALTSLISPNVNSTQFSSCGPSLTDTLGNKDVYRMMF